MSASLKLLRRASYRSKKFVLHTNFFERYDDLYSKFSEADTFYLRKQQLGEADRSKKFVMRTNFFERYDDPRSNFSEADTFYLRKQQLGEAVSTYLFRFFISKKYHEPCFC